MRHNHRVHSTERGPNRYVVRILRNLPNPSDHAQVPKRVHRRARVLRPALIATRDRRRHLDKNGLRTTSVMNSSRDIQQQISRDFMMRFVRTIRRDEYRRIECE